MARLNKKKIAELNADMNEEQENGSENAKLNAKRNKNEDLERNGSEIDSGDEVNKDHTDESNAEDPDDADDEDYVEQKNGGNAKKAAKRANDESSDDEPLNVSAAKKSKTAKTAGAGGRKAKGGKGKKGAAAKAKPKVVEKDEEEEAGEEEQDGEVDYEVQQILDHKTKNGVSYYLVRWKGFTKDDDTWEPETSLSCPDKIEAFNRKQSVPTDKKTGGKKGKKSGKESGRGGAAKQTVDPDQEYEVEKIIDYAVEKNVRKFRIRWKGFSAKDDTWEPESNLTCNDLISKFMERMQSQENISFKELREEPKKTKRLANETVSRSGIYQSAPSKRSRRGTFKKSVYYGESDD